MKIDSMSLCVATVLNSGHAYEPCCDNQATDSSQVPVPTPQQVPSPQSTGPKSEVQARGCLEVIVPVVTASDRSVEDTLEPMLRSGRSSY